MYVCVCVFFFKFFFKVSSNEFNLNIPGEQKVPDWLKTISIQW